MMNQQARRVRTANTINPIHLVKKHCRGYDKRPDIAKESLTSIYTICAHQKHDCIQIYLKQSIQRLKQKKIIVCHKKPVKDPNRNIRKPMKMNQKARNKSAIVQQTVTNTRIAVLLDDEQ
jgi:hypothetical protein